MYYSFVLFNILCFFAKTSKLVERSASTAMVIVRCVNISMFKIDLTLCLDRVLLISFLAIN
eukprot:snap_masked-scaffold_15-processed-gene-6.27-mRNA-1 protein AED:1.00 eAED:1.00 QI:0/0/0/0/1/1/3/0/60